MAPIGETPIAESHEDLIENDEEFDSDERDEMARDAAEWIMLGMPNDPSSRRTRSPEPVMASIERDSVDGQKRKWSVARAVRAVRLPRFFRGSHVKDATSWYGEDSDDGTGCLRWKGKAPQLPVDDDDDRFRRSSAPSPSSGRSSVVYMDPGPSSGRPRDTSPPSPDAGLWTPWEVVSDETHANVAEQAMPSCPTPGKKHRFSSLTHRFRRSSESSSPMTSGQTTGTGSSPRSTFSKALNSLPKSFESLFSLGRTSRASGGSPNTESSRGSFQHVEDAEKS